MVNDAVWKTYLSCGMYSSAQSTPYSQSLFSCGVGPPVQLCFTFKAEPSSILQEVHREWCASVHQVAVQVIVLTLCLLSVSAVWARGMMDCTTHPMVELVHSALVSFPSAT